MLAVLAVAKNLEGRGKHLFLSEADLVGMDAELLGELVYGPLALDRLQGDPGLELPGKLPAAHETPFLRQPGSILTDCLILGVHYST